MTQKLLPLCLLAATISAGVQAQQLLPAFASDNMLSRTLQERIALKDGSLPPIPGIVHMHGVEAKPTVAKSRIRAYSGYRFNGTEYVGISDSMHFYWSGTVGGNFDLAGFRMYSSVQANEQALPIGELEIMLPIYKDMSFDSLVYIRWNNADNAFSDYERKEAILLNTSRLPETHFSYRYAGGEWENRSRLTLGWEDGELTEFLNQEWDGAVWENASRSNLSYNASKNITAFSNFDWGAASMTWINSSRTAYNYTGTVLENHIAQYWDELAGAWVNSSRSVYGYESGELRTVTEQDWDGGSSAWEGRSRFIYTWEQDKVSERITQRWTSGAWNNREKRLYTFDVKGNITSLRVQEWDGGVWENENRYEYTYATEGSGIVITITTQEWDVANSEWKQQSRMTQRRNEHNRITELLFESWDPGGFWDVTNGDEKHVFTYEVFDDGIPSNVSQLNKVSGITCYPNPATAQITVDAAEGRMQQIRVTDVSGRTVQHLVFGQGQQHAVVPTADLIPGMYFLQVWNDGQTETVPVQVVR